MAASSVNKNLSKVKYCRIICSDIFMPLKAGFCPLLNVYFNYMQLNRSLHLSSSLWETPPPPFLRLVQKKNRPKKFPSMATTNATNWIMLAV